MPVAVGAVDAAHRRPVLVGRVDADGEGGAGAVVRVVPLPAAMSRAVCGAWRSMLSATATSPRRIASISLADRDHRVAEPVELVLVLATRSARP